MKLINKHWRGLLFSLMFLGFIATFTSCGNDEPKSEVIDYYLNIEEEFLVDGSTSHTDRYYNPITRMKAVIKAAYPKPDKTGNDDAVIEACNKEYEAYQGLYVGGKEHLTCMFHLVRATKKGDIVKTNETLKTYVYDINPKVIDGE